MGSTVTTLTITNSAHTGHLAKSGAYTTDVDNYEYSSKDGSGTLWSYFTNVQIPNGAVIVSAKLHQAFYRTSGSSNLTSGVDNAYVILDGDVAVPSGNAVTSPASSSGTGHNITFTTTATLRDVADLTTPIQELVDSESWSEGKSIHTWYTLDNFVTNMAVRTSAGSLAPRLIIEWLPPRDSMVTLSNGLRAPVYHPSGATMAAFVKAENFWEEFTQFEHELGSHPEIYYADGYWVIAQATTPGYHAASILYSSDGISWSRRQITSSSYFDLRWQQVLRIGDRWWVTGLGSLLQSNTLWYRESVNLSGSWTDLDTTSTGITYPNYHRFTYNEYLNRLILVGYHMIVQGQVASAYPLITTISPDGSARNYITTAPWAGDWWWDVATDINTARYVVVGDAGSIAHSTSVSSISRITFQSNRNWRSIAFGNNTYVALPSGSSTGCARSTNGISWTLVRDDVNLGTSVSFTGGKFVTNTGWTSTDGLTWNQELPSQSGPPPLFKDGMYYKASPNTTGKIYRLNPMRGRL